MMSEMVLVCIPADLEDADGIRGRLWEYLVQARDDMSEAELALSLTPCEYGLGTLGKEGETTEILSPDHFEMLAAAVKSIGHIAVLTLKFEAQDPDAIEATIRTRLQGGAYEGQYHIARQVWSDPDAQVGDDAPYKSIDIYYDQASIPQGYEHPLDFRNEAMEVIEAALEAQGLGEWSHAESGQNFETGEPEVNFGFTVDDFDAAERAVRKAVENTAFANIREIIRFDSAEPG